VLEELVVVVELEVEGAVVGAALAELVEPVRSIDWNVTPERFASCWSCTRRLAWSPSAGTALPSTTSLR
jgi:hypothetical protein